MAEPPDVAATSSGMTIDALLGALGSESRLIARAPRDVASILYALEWWVFGAFALFVGVRAMRDNGRNPTQPQEAQQ